MPDTKVQRPEGRNIASALFLGTNDLPPHWFLSPEYTTAGEDIVFTSVTRMQPVTISSAEIASLQIFSRSIPDPVFDGDDDL